MAQETQSVENVETRKATKEKVELAKRISERDEVGGYVTSKHAAKLLSQVAGRDIPVTTVNNLAYAGKIESFRIGGIFLFKLDGDNSVNAYLPAMTEVNAKRAERQEQAGRKEIAREAIKAYKEALNVAIANKEDLSVLRKKFGLPE